MLQESSEITSLSRPSPDTAPSPDPVTRIMDVWPPDSPERAARQVTIPRDGMIILQVRRLNSQSAVDVHVLMKGQKK